MRPCTKSKYQGFSTDLLDSGWIEPTPVLLVTNAVPQRTARQQNIPQNNAGSNRFNSRDAFHAQIIKLFFTDTEETEPYQAILKSYVTNFASLLFIDLDCDLCSIALH